MILAADAPVSLHFLGVARERHARTPMVRFSATALKLLLTYYWPGNVRELAHAVERAVLLARGPEAGPEDLLPEIERGGPPHELEFRGGVVPSRELQHRYAVCALGQFAGHRGRTADRLGVDGKTLARWLSEGGMERQAKDSVDSEKIA